jgi:hypothetical protein
LPCSYKIYSKLNDSQRNKVQGFWLNLGEDQRNEILLSAKEEENNRLAEDQCRLVHSFSSSASSRAPNTTKNDLTRLLSLQIDPSSQMSWSRLLRPKNRVELDARKSVDAVNDWDALAARFNDYTNFSPQNMACKYHDINEVPAMVKPFQPRSDEVAVLAKIVYDIDSPDITRAQILRDVSWIKEKWTLMKTTLACVFKDFDRSGQMTPSEEAEVEWLSEKEVSPSGLSCQHQESYIS